MEGSNSITIWLLKVTKVWNNVSQFHWGINLIFLMVLTYLFPDQSLRRKARYFENFKEETSVQFDMDA